jgi:hypothetical protein
VSDTQQQRWYGGGGRKAVHFGFFLRRTREMKNLSRTQLGKLVAGHLPDGKEKGFSEKRLFDIEKMPTAKRIRERTFIALGRALGWETREEFEAAWRSTPVEPYPELEDKSDESAVARLLAGELVMLNELKAAAEKKGVGLGELFREISRLWLDEHRPPKVAHTQLDGLKPRTPPAPRSAGEGSSRGESVPGPRPARRAGRNGR